MEFIVIFWNLPFYPEYRDHATLNACDVGCECVELSEPDSHYTDLPRMRTRSKKRKSLKFTNSSLFVDMLFYTNLIN